jgi:hypothetical protein
MMDNSISSRIQSTLHHAQVTEHTGRHDFGLDYSDIPTKDQPSPKLSSAGQYYLDCKRCKRAVFENGTGSAVTSTCD